MSLSPTTKMSLMTSIDPSRRRLARVGADVGEDGGGLGHTVSPALLRSKNATTGLRPRLLTARSRTDRGDIEGRWCPIHVESAFPRPPRSAGATTGGARMATSGEGPTFEWPGGLTGNPPAGGQRRGVAIAVRVPADRSSCTDDAHTAAAVCDDHG